MFPLEIRPYFAEKTNGNRKSAETYTNNKLIRKLLIVVTANDFLNVHCFFLKFNKIVKTILKFSNILQKKKKIIKSFFEFLFKILENQKTIQIFICELVNK